MSTTATRRKDATTDARVGKVDLKLEVVTIPVSDVDRAKTFYESLGWRLDADFTSPSDHVVQFTPPGSQCSIHFGTHLTAAAPGSAQGLLLIVSDIQAARDELVGRGVEVSEVFHFAGFNRIDPDGQVERPRPGPAQLRVVPVVRRPGRQHLAAAGDHDAAARPNRRRRDGIRIYRGPGERAPAGGGRPRGAREAHRAARRGLAQLVRRVHGGGAGRH